MVQSWNGELHQHFALIYMSGQLHVYQYIYKKIIKQPTANKVFIIIHARNYQQQNRMTIELTTQNDINIVVQNYISIRGMETSITSVSL